MTKKKKDTKKVQAKQAVGTVSTTKRINKVETEEEVREDVGEPQMFTDPPCNVGFSAGLTINLGDFNNAKVQVSINVPCKHDEIDETFEFTKRWVDDNISELQEELEPTPKSKKRKKK